jgi:hypothetical protein
VGIAKQLGITNGKGNGQFNPRENISRQDMFVMAARALEAAGVWEADSISSVELNKFNDQASISAYAANDIAAMVEARLVQGDARGHINPLSNASRAEAAALIYRIYNSQ